MRMNGDAVRAIRIYAGLTQEAFARRLGVSKSCVAEAESGRRPVSPALRIKIAQVYGVSPEIKKAIADAKASAELAAL